MIGQSLDRTGFARLADAEGDGAVMLVACGQPLPHHEIRVVDEADRELPERQEGRLQFRGPSATKGYFQNPEKTRALFDGSWLETGDRGYIAGGDVFVTGRIKDLIKRAGRNIYPQELEEAIGSLEGARKGCVAVFPTLDPRAGTERLIIMAETRLTDATAREGLRKAIIEASQSLLDLAPDEVVLAPPHAVPKTSSGKIRRSAARAMFEGGLRELGRSSPRWQLLRVALAGAGPRLRKSLSNLGALAYGAYAWCVLTAIAAWVWPCVVLSPRREWRHQAAAAGARLFFWLTRIRLNVHSDAAPPSSHAIIVANHSSYLDGAVVTAVCPGEISFVAKEGLAHQFFAGIFLRRLGAIFVRRLDPAGGVVDARAALEVGAGGRVRRLVSGRNIFANARIIRVSCRRFRHRSRARPCRHSSHNTRNPFDPAKRIVAPAARRNLRSHWRADQALRRRFPGWPPVARCSSHANPGPLRRAGPCS